GGLAGAYQPAVRPPRSPSPLPHLAHLGGCRPDQGAQPREHLAPPVAQALDSRVYQRRWRLGGLRPRPTLLHISRLSLVLDSGYLYHRAQGCGSELAARLVEFAADTLGVLDV